MKITKERLRRIIKEEIEAVVDEGFLSKAKAKVGFGNKKLTKTLIKVWQAYDTTKKFVDELENIDKLGDGRDSIAGKKEGYKSYDLGEPYTQLSSLIEKATKLKAQHGLDSSQKIRWEDIPTKASQLLYDLAGWIKVAVSREEGEAAAKEKEEEMASRHRAWLAADEERGWEKMKKRGTKDTGLQY